jgi:hypothetical protein
MARCRERIEVEHMWTLHTNIPTGHGTRCLYVMQSSIGKKLSAYLTHLHALIKCKRIDAIAKIACRMLFVEHHLYISPQ